MLPPLDEMAATVAVPVAVAVGAEGVAGGRRQVAVWQLGAGIKLNFNF